MIKLFFHATDLEKQLKKWGLFSLEERRYKVVFVRQKKQIKSERLTRAEQDTEEKDFRGSKCKEELSKNELFNKHSD